MLAGFFGGPFVLSSTLPALLGAICVVSMHRLWTSRSVSRWNDSLGKLFAASKMRCNDNSPQHKVEENAQPEAMFDHVLSSLVLDAYLSDC